MLFTLSFLSSPAFSQFVCLSDLHLLFDLPWSSMFDTSLSCLGQQQLTNRRPPLHGRWHRAEVWARFSALSV